MALLGKDWDGTRQGSATPSATMDGRATDTDGGGMTAFLGRGSMLTGKVTLEGPGRIDGQVEGEITAADTLVIGEHAIVIAQITGTSIVIHGTVTGDITARTRLEVRAPAKVVGNLDTKCLVIHEGATFEGRCSMGGADVSKLRKDKNSSVLLRGEKHTEATIPPALS